MDTENQKGGYLKLWRSFGWGELWEEMPFSHGKLFLWLLMEATHKGNTDRRGLKPGQINHSVRFMCQAMKWYDRTRHKEIIPSQPTIYKALERLKNDGSITTESTPRVVAIITICNWETYQSDAEGGNSSANSSGKSKLKAVQEEQEVPPSTPPPHAHVPKKSRRQKKVDPRIKEIQATATLLLTDFDQLFPDAPNGSAELDMVALMKLLTPKDMTDEPNMAYGKTEEDIREYFEFLKKPGKLKYWNRPSRLIMSSESGVKGYEQIEYQMRNDQEGGNRSSKQQEHDQALDEWAGEWKEDHKERRGENNAS